MRSPPRPPSSPPGASVARRLTPAQVALLHPDRPGRVFVDCVECGARDTIRVDNLDAVTDEQATRWFEERGWSVKPTLCPGCLRLGAA